MHIARAFTQSIRYCLLKEHLLRVCDNAYTESIYSELVLNAYNESGYSEYNAYIESIHSDHLLNAYTKSSYSEYVIMHIPRAFTQSMW